MNIRQKDGSANIATSFLGSPVGTTDYTWCRCHPARGSIETNIEDPVAIRGMGSMSCIVDRLPTSVGVEHPNLV